MEDVGTFLARLCIGAVPCIRWLCAGYSARTAIYLLQRLGAHHLKIHDLTSLRLLGIVAINIAAWNLHHEHVGKRESAVVDTFWWVQRIPWCPPTLNTHRQTDTGPIVTTSLPGPVETKPGSVTVPSFGIAPTILDPVKGKVLEANNFKGVLVLKTPWTAIACTVHAVVSLSHLWIPSWLTENNLNM